jgi:hypothetical protein
LKIQKSSKESDFGGKGETKKKRAEKRRRR